MLNAAKKVMDRRSAALEEAAQIVDKAAVFLERRATSSADEVVHDATLMASDMMELVAGEIRERAETSSDDRSPAPLFLPTDPSPVLQMTGVQALLNSLDRTAIAKLVDPSAWINEDGYEIEQDHSGTSLHVADQIITYVLRTARALTTEGQDNG